MERRARRREPAIATVHHGFTHFTLDLHLVARADPPPGEGWWQPLDRLDEAGLPTLYRRAAEAGHARESALPDPFFAGPGLDRADALRAHPERIAALAQRPDARRWRGTMARPRSTRTAG